MIFGVWDSTGPKGGLGAKFQRALVSEIVGVNAEIGTKTSSRADPLQIRAAAKVVKSKDGYTLAKDEKTIDAESLQTLKDAVAAEEKGVTWRKDPLPLKPAPQLVELPRRSQEIAAAEGPAEDGE